MLNLPEPCIDALRRGFQFSGWKLFRSAIGPIKLKSYDDLECTTIETFPGCQSILDDPYQSFDGVYQIEAIDLVAESEIYGTEGFFCWLPALSTFAAVDPEHGDVLTFRDANWSQIAKSPRRYLDAQWGLPDFGTRVLPWLYFDFKFTDSDTVLSPYPALCDRHSMPVAGHRRTRHPMFDAFLDRDPDAWLTASIGSFPYCGLPTGEATLLSCDGCFDAEAAWLQAIDDSIPVLDARKNKGGFIQCPNCGNRFSPADRHSFVDGLHTRCGQKINVLERDG